ncbi:MAG: 5-(carboxyamino)imidazole ribonucleotide synthase [Acidobacteriota bacterium]
MTQFSQPTVRLGIIGGGQLARMTVPRAKQLGCSVTVLDPTPDSPGMQMADRRIVGAFDDSAALHELATSCDVTTFDIETVETSILEALAADGVRIVPSPRLLSTVQDKLAQKRAYEAKGIPTAPFAALDTPSLEAFEAFGFPLVQKARTGGYDGRGVAVLRSPDDLELALPVPSLVERFITHEKELAVMVARGLTGETAVYPVVEMVFDPRANILDELLAPARIDAELVRAAQELAIRTVEALDGVGVFGVELFSTPGGELLVNEIAPRTHNSGHYTIEACVTDQFEQQVRAIMGLPLGSTEQLRPAALRNLLGAPESVAGATMVHGLDEALALDGVAVHLYGKAQSRPFRKMGHVTAIADTLETARERAARAAELLVIEGSEG